MVKLKLLKYIETNLKLKINVKYQILNKVYMYHIKYVYFDPTSKIILNQSIIKNLFIYIIINKSVYIISVATSQRIYMKTGIFFFKELIFNSKASPR
jgi:hypothetical protein